MNRKRIQAELVYQLGQLTGPLAMLAEHPSGYDRDERTRILARFFPGVPKFLTAFHQFSRGEPGHDYQPEFSRAENAFEWFRTRIMSDPEYTQLGQFAENIRLLCARVFDAVYSVPVPVESAIHEAHTPFSTYCMLKDLCSTARNQVVWMDRYFDQTLFGLYFVHTPKDATVTLVTYPESECKGNKDRQRYADFLAVSKLFAQERGPVGYRLLTDDAFHDRWLRCDDKLYALGGSVKDLGKETTFTLTKIDSIPANLQQFEEPLARGTEVFGPGQPNHP